MTLTYTKATSVKELINAIHSMDIEHVREHGISLVVPFLDKKTRNKVKIIQTNNAKKLYEEMLEGYNLWKKGLS